MASNVDVSGALQVVGASTMAGVSATALNASAATRLATTLDVSGALRVVGASTMAGVSATTLNASAATRLATTLDVSGASNFVGTVTLPGGALWSTSASAGAFYSGSTDPSANTRVNYNGNLHVNNLAAMGNVTAFSTATTSDARLKEHIVDFAEELDAGAALDAIRPVAYTDRTNRRRIGFIAQELREVVPHVVNEDQITGFLSVAYGDLVALLAEEAKAARRERDIAKAEIAELRAMVSALLESRAS